MDSPQTANTLALSWPCLKQSHSAYSSDIPKPKIGAVSFFQNFGNTLNVHPHFHLIVADGVFSVEEDTLIFCESRLDSEDIVDIEECKGPDPPFVDYCVDSPHCFSYTSLVVRSNRY